RRRARLLGGGVVLGGEHRAVRHRRAAQGVAQSRQVNGKPVGGQRHGGVVGRVQRRARALDGLRIGEEAAVGRAGSIVPHQLVRAGGEVVRSHQKAVRGAHVV